MASWRWHAFVAVVRDTKPVWLGITPPCLAVALAWAIPKQGEFCVRAAGYVLTLLGAGLVARGIAGTQTLFGRPKVSARLRQWGSRLVAVFRHPRPIIGAGMSSSGGSSMSGTGTVRWNARSRDLHERVRVLEKNLYLTEERITSTEQRLGQEIQRARDELGKELSAADTRVVELSNRLEQYSTSGLDAELIGLVWVVFGQAFGAFPAEIAGFILRWDSFALQLWPWLPRMR